MNRILKHHATFFDYVRRRQKLEHLAITIMIEGKHRRGKQREKISAGL